MSILNLGKKDEYGRQRRIEHRGKYLRASRTGGVALRAQVKAAGVNLTVNSNQGLRVSTTPLKNTQLALQNGRFVLRGRYGRGPHRLNLSKSGVSVSSRNALGSFNWVQPNRSSVKIAGIQMRGKNAAQLQIIFMLVLLALWAVQLAARATITLLHLTIDLLALLYRSTLATLYTLRALRRRWRNRQFAASFSNQNRLFEPPLGGWPQEALLAGLMLILEAWGRGLSPGNIVTQLEKAIPAFPAMQVSTTTLSTVANQLQQARENQADSLATDPRTIAARFSQELSRQMAGDDLIEALLEMDELLLQQGPRTCFQERLLEVITDFSGLGFIEQPK